MLVFASLPDAGCSPKLREEVTVLPAAIPILAASSGSLTGGVSSPVAPSEVIHPWVSAEFLSDSLNNWLQRIHGNAWYRLRLAASGPGLPPRLGNFMQKDRYTYF